MLQRAASNAYSWWWASHIRTKQSKCLQHNLLDMEEKVKYTLKIIDGEGDSFAKRAEMYYRKRPEIVNFIEEAFRSYRALAERYDHLSTELQSANHMIATAFPEHVPFHDDDDDHDGDDDDDDHDGDDDDDGNSNPEKPSKHFRVIHKESNIPEVPEIPKKEFKSQSLMTLSRTGPCDLKTLAPSSVGVSSGLNREVALEKINKLHKGILVLQTEKEFVRSSYEQSYGKYWELENEVTEMQNRVCSLQDEFGVGEEIDDGEARTLVASTALRSCKETIAKLEEMQQRFAEDAEIEKERIGTAMERLKALRNKSDNIAEQSEVLSGQESSSESAKEMSERDVSDNRSNMEIAEKIDELVEKVVSLETTVSSHTALVNTLKSETDELNEHIRGVEEDKGSLVSDSKDMEKRITAIEEELSKVRNLFQRVEDQNNILLEHLKEANRTAEHLTGKLQDVKMDEDVAGSEHNLELHVVSEDAQEEDPNEDFDSVLKETEIEKAEDIKEAIGSSHDHGDQESVQEKSEIKDSSSLPETASTCFVPEAEDQGTKDENVETTTWRQLLPDAMEDREKVLFDEYTSVLKDYREVKRKLSEVEKKNREGFFELALQLRELKNAVSCEDRDFHLLRQKMASKDSSHPVENKQLDHESLTISPSSNPVISMALQQRGEDLKRTSERAKENEVKATFPDIDESIRRKLTTAGEKVRADIDAVLEENVEFWLRFSTSAHQIQKYQTAVQDLKADLSKLRSWNKQQNSALPSDTKPIFRHLKEIRTELQLWLENTAVLRDELQGRYTTLCNIKDDISRVTSHSGGTKVINTEISGYQAAKFHGEILNMTHDNKKVFNELQAGLDRARTLKTEVERVVSKAEQDIGILYTTTTRTVSKNTSAEKPRIPVSKNISAEKPRIPLRSFLFGVKLKKYKQQQQRQTSSIFSCVSPSPALQKQCSYIIPPVNLPE